MSEATERRTMKDTLVGYSLMGIPELAEFLGCSPPVARRMVEEEDIPSIPVGRVRKVDPLDAAVHALAGKEGVTPDEFRKRHGRATAKLAGEYFREVMDFKGEAA